MKKFLGLMAVLLNSAAWAQATAPTPTASYCGASGSSACTFNIIEHKIQPVPTMFKFQAHVSQSKMPVGKASITTLVVKVLD